MPAKNTTPKIICFKITAKEHYKFKRLAKRSGIPIGPIIRGLLRHSCTRQLSDKELSFVVKLGAQIK